MNTPLPILTSHKPLTHDDRATMHGVEIRIRPTFGGWESSVLNVETDEEIDHSPVQDSPLAAFIIGDAMWHQELAERKSQEREASQVEAKGER